MLAVTSNPCDLVLSKSETTVAVHIQDVEKLVLTVLSSDTCVWLALVQLADTGGTATAGDSGPAPAALLLPQRGTAHRYTLGTGNTVGQARDASSTAAAGHRHLGWARLLRGVLGWEEWMGRGKEIMGGKVTERLQKRNMRRKEIKEQLILKGKCEKLNNGNFLYAHSQPQRCPIMIPLDHYIRLSHLLVASCPFGDGLLNENCFHHW